MRRVCDSLGWAPYLGPYLVLGPHENVQFIIIYIREKRQLPKTQTYK